MQSKAKTSCFCGKLTGGQQQAPGGSGGGQRAIDLVSIHDSLRRASNDDIRFVRFLLPALAEKSPSRPMQGAERPHGGA